MRLLGTLVLLTCFFNTSRGQHTLALRMHDDVLQSYRFYPQSQQRDTAWTIGLPSASLYLGNSGFSYNDIVASDGDSSYLTFEPVISKLHANNYLTASVSLPFITLSRRWGAWQATLHQAEVLSINVRYTKEMAEFLWYGNTRFIGKEVNLAPDAEMLRFYETALTLSRKVGKWRFGTSIKYLEGVSCISIQGNQLNVYTEAETYNLRVQTDIEIHQSNTKKISRIGAFPERWFKNPGMGLDVGASREITKRIDAHVSLTNLGFIRWRKNVKTQKSSNEFQFNGLDLSEFILGDSLNVSEYEDSLMQLLSFTEEQGSFTSYTIPRLHIGVDYQLNDKYEFGLFGQWQFLNHGTQFTTSVSAIRHFQIKKHSVNLGAHYAYRNRNPYNFGLSGDYRWRFIQVFLMSDNMLSWLLPKAYVPISLFDSKSDDQVIIPKQLNSINFHFGINIILTKKK